MGPARAQAQGTSTGHIPQGRSVQAERAPSAAVPPSLSADSWPIPVLPHRMRPRVAWS